MIITRTPYRISFFGGGTDYADFYREHGGLLLTSTLDKACYVCARWMPPYLGNKYRIMWSRMEDVNERSEIQHPAVRGCLEYLAIDQGFEVNHAGDLPARSGLGSSSAFTVGLLHALHGLEGRYVGRDQLARQAIDVEQNVLKEVVGIQDQIECAYGGLNVIEIRREGEYEVRPVVLHAWRLEQLRSHLMLYFTGLVRNSSDVAAAQVANTHNKVPELKAMMALVGRAVKVLTDDGHLDAFGEMLHDAWLMKRGMSAAVTNEAVDRIYNLALLAGATGGKILGAGGGGFMLLFVRPEHQAEVRVALRDYLEVPVGFDAGGSRIVHCDR